MSELGTSRAARSRLGAVARCTLAASLVWLVSTASPVSADATFNQRLLELVNEERLGAGLAPVVTRKELAGVAQSAPYNGCGFPVAGRAADMGTRNYFSHTIAGCGQGVSSMVNATGLVYSGLAENIAWASALSDPLVAAANLHAQLMSSPVHRANLMNPAFNAVGVGSWHTAPGATWSGAGPPLTRVYIAVQIFAGLPEAPSGPGDVYHALSPARVLDTRTGVGAPATRLTAGAALRLQVAGRGGVPALGATAVVMNVTVVDPTAASFLTVFPAGEAKPGVSNLNYGPGQTVPNLVTAKLGPGGQVVIFNAAGSADVVADVAGWYGPGVLGLTGARYNPLTPARVMDTRGGIGAAARLGPNTTMDIQITGRGGVPASGVSAVVLNVTVAGPTSPSYLTVFPKGERLPLASNLNYVAGQTVANAVSVKVGAEGRVSVYNAAGSTDVIADVAGWFDSNLLNLTGARFHPVTPARILDTRAGIGAAPVALGAGARTTMQVTGRGGVPSSGVSAVVMNVTATAPTSLSFLTVYPAGEPVPLASSLNFVGGQTVPNLVTVKVGTGGQAAVYNASGTVHVIADVAGWYDTG